MIVTILSVLSFQILLLLSAMVERTISVPFVTVILFLVSCRSFSTLFFFIYVSMLSLILAAVMMQGWLIVFLVLTAGGIIIRANIFQIQTSFPKVLLLIGIMGSLISSAATPVLSSSYVFHSLFSFFIAALIAYKSFSLKEKKLRWKNIRFGESD